MFIIIIIAILAILVFLLIRRKYTYWERRNIRGPSPLPIVGNMLDYIILRKHFSEVFDDIYRDYPKAKFVGLYKMGLPTVLVRDLDLVRDILVSNFSSFSDNEFTVDPSLDPLMASSPFATKTAGWKSSRQQIAPLFTSSKVRQLYPLTKNVCDGLITYIESVRESGDGIFETKELSSKFTVNNIASCAFGVEGGTFIESSSKFYTHSRNLFIPSLKGHMKSMLALFVPFLSKIVRLPFISPETDRWIREVVTEVIDYRKKTGDVRNDFLQALLQFKEKGSIDLETVFGHSLLFLFEGFETSSTMMSYALYYISKLAHVQDKLHDEIDRAIEKHGDLNEDAINELPYLEKIFYESLRLHPTVFALQKIAMQDYEMPPQYDGSDRTTIGRGTSMIIPVSAIHMDPEIFENPTNFDPSRFDDDVKRDKYSFLGFGEGPRICVGMKFGMMQSKAAIALIMAKYPVEFSTKTVEPLQISKTNFLLASKYGIYVKFLKRK